MAFRICRRFTPFAVIYCLFHGVILVSSDDASNWDTFNYDQTNGNDFGPSDWDQVRCSNLETCKGWPDPWEMAIDWELKENSW